MGADVISITSFDRMVTLRPKSFMCVTLTEPEMRGTTQKNTLHYQLMRQVMKIQLKKIPALDLTDK